MEAGSTDRTGTGGVASTISDELARLHARATGGPAPTVTTHVLEDAVLAVVEIEPFRHEQTLLEAGLGNAARQHRLDYEAAAESRFVAAVERATGRSVTAFLSDVSLQPPLAIEFFSLGRSA